MDSPTPGSIRLTFAFGDMVRHAVRTAHLCSAFENVLRAVYRPGKLSGSDLRGEKAYCRSLFNSSSPRRVKHGRRARVAR